MSDPMISVENLGKRYTLRHQSTKRYSTLRDSVAGLWARAASRQGPASHEEFWALHEVSFEMPRGEVLGIIGRNGAGKSTLLKILSRITEPSQGRVTLDGRVASLLEVGTGFHPELTGRENIHLNGAILGMTRREITASFDEIVAFAEVERFLDTPVKRYSSGMYVRLAFSVAAHLRPEILVVDEVLAVGDAQFQAKCLGKMESVARQSGRTILFVSHQMSAVRRLCSSVLWLDRGRVVEHSRDVEETVQRYLRGGQDFVEQLPARVDLQETPRDKGAACIFTAVSLESARHAASAVFEPDEAVAIVIECDLHGEIRDSLTFSIQLSSSGGERVATWFHGDNTGHTLPSSGTFVCRCVVPALHLAPGDYWIGVGAGQRGDPLDKVNEALMFRIESRETTRSGMLQAPSTWEVLSA
ncbi:MAG: ABC transporter ATP-binding protein [Verrucomicrobiota bacterium]